jgi:hypothetical protein
VNREDRGLEDRLFKQYEAELNGEAARRRSEENARREQWEREEEIRVWASRIGSPLPRDLEE